MRNFLLQHNFKEKALIITSQKCYKDLWPSLWEELLTNIPTYEVNLSLHKRHANRQLQWYHRIFSNGEKMSFLNQTSLKNLSPANFAFVMSSGVESFLEIQRGKWQKNLFL